MDTLLPLAFFHHHPRRLDEMITRNKDREEMLLSVVPLVWWHARRTPRPKTMDVEDLAQVGILSVVEKIDQHDPTRGSWDGYAAATARWEMRRHVRNQESIIRLPSGDQVSDRLKQIRRRAQKVQALAGRPVFAEDQQQRQDDYLDGRELLERARELLTDREYDILCRWLGGDTLKQIATDTGCVPSLPGRVVKAALEVLRASVGVG